MTEISFHFNIPQRVPYVCRLLRKATAKGAQLLVTGPREELEAIDRMLWQLSPVDFVGHAWMEASSGGDEGEGTEHAAMAVARERARVWLSESVCASDRHRVLVNLHASIAEGFEQFERLIEIVSLDASDRNDARQRWRYYGQRGYQIIRHDVQVTGG